jgi:hypothetical protein
MSAFVHAHGRVHDHGGDGARWPYRIRMIRT